MIRGSTLIVILVVWVLSESLAAQEPYLYDPVQFARGDPSIRLTLKKSVRLEPVTLSELLGTAGGGAIDEGVWTGSGSLSPVTPDSVFRSIESLWRCQLSSGIGDPLSNVEVNYMVTGVNGNEGVLSHIDKPESEILVTLQPHPSVVVGSSAKTVFLEGGVSLYLDMEKAGMSGGYSGTLTVTINEF